MESSYSSVSNVSDDQRSGSDFLERRGLMEALDASQSLVWFDAHGVIVDANANALRLFAYTADQIVKQDYFALCRSPESQKIAERREWSRIMNGQTNHTERSYVTKDGQEVWTSVSFAVIKNNDGSTRRVLAIFLDMSRFAWKPNDTRRAL